MRLEHARRKGAPARDLASVLAVALCTGNTGTPRLKRHTDASSHVHADLTKSGVGIFRGNVVSTWQVGPRKKRFFLKKGGVNGRKRATRTRSRGP